MTIHEDDNRLDNLNIESIEPLPSPQVIRADFALDDKASSTVADGRRAVSDIIDQNDPRLLVVVGPCSIHDLKAGLEYATLLHEFQHKVARQMLLVMRVYFEKPRTTTGWKGLINDPHLDDSFDVETGLRQARSFLLQLANIGIPAATEALDPIVPQYLGDLISWYAIGARTAESQTHREMASGLSAPCGFKNATDGNIQLAVNGITSSRGGHHFLGITETGSSAIVRTRGNAHAHLILRGGVRPNYDVLSIEAAASILRANDLVPSIMIDCSHGNSDSDPANQTAVANECLRQRLKGQRAIVGLMLESNLHWGNQPLTNPKSDLRYGVSITDGCIDWPTTVELLFGLAERIHNAA